MISYQQPKHCQREAATCVVQLNGRHSGGRAYTYKPTTSLVSGYTTGAGASQFAVNYDYPADFSRRNMVEAKYGGGAAIARFDLVFDSRGPFERGQALWFVVSGGLARRAPKKPGQNTNYKA